LSTHLKRKHIIQYKVRKKQSTNIENLDEADEVPEILKLPETQLQVRPSSIVSLQKTQTRIESYTSKPLSITKSQKLDEQIGIMIAKEFQPFSLVENKEFKRFVHMLNPGYSLPSRKTISKSIIPQLYEKTKDKIRVNLPNAQYVAFTTDGWTSINNDSFVALTVHFIDQTNCNLKTFLLGCYYFEKSHTASNLSDFLNNCFKEWDIAEKVKVAVSDSAANITAAINMNKNWRHIPCLAHSINLIAQSGLDEIQYVHKKVKRLVEHFKRSSQAYAKLKNTQKQMGYDELKLIQDVSTRWHSTYDMFLRSIRIK